MTVRDDGWPKLDREGPPIERLTPHASYPELARVYATIVVRWRQTDWPKVVDALEWLHGAVWGMREQIHRDLEAWRQALVQEQRAHLEELRGSLQAELAKRPPSVRPPPRAPDMDQFRPEQTIGGGIRVTDEAWQAVQAKLGELLEDKEEADRLRDIAQAEARGAQAALAQLATAGEKRWISVLRWLTVLGAICGLLAWLIAHIWHP